MRGRATGPVILSARNVPILGRFAASNVLVGFDFDGTLAPIVPDRASARMRGRTRRLLTQVATRYPCVIISGRRLRDLTERVRDVPVQRLMGDHGFEPQGAPGAVSPYVRDWIARLRAHLPDDRGVILEPKSHSVTVHYRHARDQTRVLEGLARAMHRIRDARTVQSPEAINILPRGGTHKGHALQQARHAFECDTAIYVGDDDTDEDAFASAGPERLLSIRVGAGRPSVARYRLRQQVDIDRFLEALIEFRPG